MLETPSAVVLTLLVLISVVSVVRNILEIIRGGRRQPSVDEELKLYVLKVEHDRDVEAVRAETVRRCAELKAENAEQWAVVNAERATIRKNMEDVNRFRHHHPGARNPMKNKTPHILFVCLLGLLLLVLVLPLGGCATPTPNITGPAFARSYLQEQLADTAFDNTFHHVQLTYDRKARSPIVQHAGGHFHVTLPGYDPSYYYYPSEFEPLLPLHIEQAAQMILHIIASSPQIRNLPE